MIRRSQTGKDRKAQKDSERGIGLVPTADCKRKERERNNTILHI